MTSLLLGRDVEGRDTEQSQTTWGGRTGPWGPLKKGPVGIFSTFCCRG